MQYSAYQKKVVCDLGSFSPFGFDNFLHEVVFLTAIAFPEPDEPLIFPREIEQEAEASPPSTLGADERAGASFDTFLVFDGLLLA
mmetsp:Transcript_10341/g.16912  ORF Transcript_10341/g.16912 Transcript_10341/m.16912 type:complete len:85 (-) Transcript_10341:34-288(-)